MKSTSSRKVYTLSSLVTVINYRGFYGRKILGVIRVDDVPGCKDLVEIFGMDTFISLVEYCGGSNVYIPSKGAIVKKARNRIMREVFDGGNYREIANRFGISEVAVRKIVGR